MHGKSNTPKSTARAKYVLDGWVRTSSIVDLPKQLTFVAKCTDLEDFQLLLCCRKSKGRNIYPGNKVKIMYETYVF